ncbi:MAG: hypothetical protein ABSA82_09955 [Thermacetogeniaceae bacterium]
MRKTAIVIGQVQINDIRNNASLLSGDNTQRGWRSHSKINYSLGRVNGDANLINSRLNYLSDPDCIDVQITTYGSGEERAAPGPGAARGA